MKRFDELSHEEQQQALEQCLGSILEGILDGKFLMDDEKNKNDAQAVIDAQIARAAEMTQEERGAGARTVAVGLIMESSFTETDGSTKKMSDELLELARADAEESWFLEPGDKIVRLEVPTPA